MKCGLSPMPRFSDSTLKPAPRTPVGASILISIVAYLAGALVSSVRALFECQTCGAWPQRAHHDGNDHHARGDKGEDSRAAKVAQSDCDQEARENRRQSAE